MKIEEFKTNCLGFELIVLLGKNGYLVGARTEEGGSYPLLDFELDKLWLRHAFAKENRNYDHLYSH